MATVNQVYTVINQVAKESLGRAAITVTDPSSYIALGDYILNSDNVNCKDRFVQSLTDVIGRTLIDVRELKMKDNKIYKNTFDYGCILRKINVKLPNAKINNSWEIGKSDFKADYAPVIKPTINEKLFSKMVTWEFAVTIPDSILETALHNAQEMASVISAIFLALDNSINLALFNMINLTRASFIARKIKSSDNFPLSAINVLADYNTLTNKTLTVQGALADADFLRYVTRLIFNLKNYLKTPSTLFNTEDYERQTDDDYLCIDMLSDFSNVLKVNLASDVYNAEMVNIGKYDEVPFWQGSGTSFSFNDISKVNVKLDEVTTIEQTGVIAVFYDSEAIGVTMEKKRRRSVRNDESEYTNYHDKSTMMYFNDMSCNGVVLYMA